MTAKTLAVAKLLKPEGLEEEEYKVPFGKVIVSQAGDGYKIVVCINEKSLGKSTVKEIVQSLLASAGGEKAV